ncbi:MAG: bifunctional folylpolyglutamate synthase/dihydrofolate synthase, partial [Maioricimonas sp. JB049]
MQDFETHDRPLQPPLVVSPDFSAAADATERYQAALDYIYRRIDYERTSLRRRHLADFKLQRPAELLRRLGSPHEQIPAVHIAGTKGKGSTAAMVASMLSGCGYRVGLFTSPHMVRFEERMTVDGRMPGAEQLCTLTDRVREVADALQNDDPAMAPTFFEITTALAWLYFLAEHVDLVVLETGLGGRLDTTTLCRPLVTLITSISYDHTALLGRTLGAIAREKAGIAKADVPMLSGVCAPEPAAPIAAASRT